MPLSGTFQRPAQLGFGLGNSPAWAVASIVSHVYAGHPEILSGGGKPRHDLAGHPGLCQPGSFGDPSAGHDSPGRDLLRKPVAHDRAILRQDRQLAVEPCRFRIGPYRCPRPCPGRKRTVCGDPERRLPVHGFRQVLDCREQRHGQRLGRPLGNPRLNPIRGFSHARTVPLGGSGRDVVAIGSRDPEESPARLGGRTDLCPGRRG